jgi:hypothetical protein
MFTEQALFPADRHQQLGAERHEGPPVIGEDQLQHLHETLARRGHVPPPRVASIHCTGYATTGMPQTSIRTIQPPAAISRETESVPPPFSSLSLWLFGSLGIFDSAQAPRVQPRWHGRRPGPRSVRGAAVPRGQRPRCCRRQERGPVGRAWRNLANDALIIEDVSQSLAGVCVHARVR